MEKLELAIDIASVLFGKRVSGDNWKVRDLRTLKKDILEDLHRMAGNADPKFGWKEFCQDCQECGGKPCMCDVEVVPGYTRRQLDSAFKAVENSGGWKGPIDSWVQIEDLKITEAAIHFFTATYPTVIDHRGSEVRIYSIGYQLGPAGDH